MLSRIISFCVLLGISISAAVGQDPVPGPAFRIVGYLPNYRVADFDPVAARNLTDIILFSGEPTVSGTLAVERIPKIPADKIEKLQANRDPIQRVRFILCIGGWERSKNFAGVVGSLDRRRRLAVSVHQYCVQHGISGVDLDWEHPKNELEEQGYAELLEELQTELGPDDIGVSLTMAAWQKLPPSAFDFVDAVHVMAYDNRGRHSTFESAKADVQKLIDQGIPAEKIILGMPFYGRDTTKRDTVLTYGEIVSKYKPAADADEVGTLYFNGPNTIRQKTAFALEKNLGGVMVWEIGQDAKGKDSLLKVIADTVNSPRKTP